MKQFSAFSYVLLRLNDWNEQVVTAPVHLNPNGLIKTVLNLPSFTFVATIKLKYMILSSII